MDSGKIKIAIAASAACIAAVAANAAIDVIPLPAKVAERGGVFSFRGDIARIAKFSKDASIPAEGYRISVTPSGVAVAASDAAGGFYAVQTLRQLETAGGDGVTAIPCVEIEDAPRFKWRGLHFDDCRHFFGKEALKRTLDFMALHKMNVLHWHLTDDQGWRIEIKKYPRLAEVGSVRRGSPKRARDIAKGEKKKNSRWVCDDVKYGPYFYTQEDVKEILAYAAARHIKVVPEIELPGHAVAAVAAYPWLGCTGKNPGVRWQWGISRDIFCAGNDKTIKFLEDVLDEVCALFPSDVIHIGGDEAPKHRWKHCPKCQKRIKELGLAGEEGLQGWMTRHFTEYLAKKGRRAVGWDEVLAGNPGKDTIVMSWRGSKGGIAAAKRGNDVVMTPNDFCYLDYGQGLKNDPHEYIGGKVTLEKAYSLEPTAGIPAESAKRMLGLQGNNWSEYTWTPEELEYKMWPRASALAEVMWTPPERKNFADFRRRAAKMRKFMSDAFGANCAPVQ